LARLAAQATCVAFGAVTSACWGADGSDASVEAPPSAPPVRDIRVLIVTDAHRLRVRAQRPVELIHDDGTVRQTGAPGRWTVLTPTSSGDFLLDGGPTRVTVGTLRARGGAALTLSFRRAGDWSSPRTYPGLVRLRVSDEGLIDATNEVDIETYVAAVVAEEVWPTFETEAYRAQAIVARTYALYQMQRRRSRSYDITAAEASQVYDGLRTDEVGVRASRAAAYTRGVVCTHPVDGTDRLFSTYYHAACGGMTQSASIFGQADDIAPLAGGVVCDFCKIAPGNTYRWGPVTLSKRELMDRLVARYPQLESLGVPVAIDVVERAAGGRPKRIRLTGSNGKTHAMLAERFRLAVGARLMRSTCCDIRLDGPNVILENGKGFGHGLGLCQWGAQAQALAGKKAGEILRYYYPGAKLTRAY
jgi:stage II sporulation protein D